MTAGVLILWALAAAAVITLALRERRWRRGERAWEQLADTALARGEGYRQAALHNKGAAEELEARVEALTYEVALLRAAVHTLPGPGSDEPGELDVRA